jgi:predicted NBD/HSP70 family sugar kinase
MKPNLDRGSLFTLNNIAEKELKNLEILELIKQHGSISRAEISKLTGINIVSICNYMNHYIDNGVIAEKGFDVSTGGRKPELVELDSGSNLVIGLDIDNERVRGVLTDLKLGILGRSESPIQNGGVDAACGSIVDEFSRKSVPGRNKIRAIGIGAPDTKSAKNKGFVMDICSDIFIGDNALCAAAGERYTNPAAMADPLLYLFSSLGKGVVVKGKDFIDDTYSKEAGYLRPWHPSSGMTAEAKKEIAKGVGTIIVDLVKADIGKISEETIIEAAKRGDEIALITIQNIASSLGIRVAYMVNLFGIKAVVIGGGIEKCGDIMLDIIKNAVMKLSSAKMAPSVKIFPSLLGEDAVSVGAASMAVREIFLRI